jgi:hypothetical protein
LPETLSKSAKQNPPDRGDLAGAEQAQAATNQIASGAAGAAAG